MSRQLRTSAWAFASPLGHAHRGGAWRDLRSAGRSGRPAVAARRSGGARSLVLAPLGPPGRSRRHTPSSPQAAPPAATRSARNGPPPEALATRLQSWLRAHPAIHSLAHHRGFPGYNLSAPMFGKVLLTGGRQLRTSAWALAGVLSFTLSGCASWPRSFGTRPCCIATNKPLVTRQPIWWHLFDVTVLSQIEQAFDLIRVSRKFLGAPVRAFNLRDGQILDSTFFTNRDPAQLSPEEIRWGPTRPEDLAQPPLVMTKSKVEGKTPGFFATDAKGTRYLLKLDPVDGPELLSGAEVVSSKLLHALGYHVPSYEVLLLGPDELQIGPGMMAKNRHGRPTPFTEAELHAIVEPRLREGRWRVVASKLLEGEILGPAPFKRFRDCAEMRALKVAYAWINDIDTKDHNSLLVWNGKETVGYLIDFGTSLGADAGRAGPKHRCAGWLNLVDLPEASLKLMTFGTHQPACDPSDQAMSPSVGFFTSRVDLDRWKPYAPNLAFEEMTQEDARWMARRMARLSTEQVEAAVSAGQYTDPADAAYLVEVLTTRRDTIVRHYIEDSLTEGSRP